MNSESDIVRTILSFNITYVSSPTCATLLTHWHTLGEQPRIRVFWCMIRETQKSWGTLREYGLSELLRVQNVAR